MILQRSHTIAYALLLCLVRTRAESASVVDGPFGAGCLLLGQLGSGFPSNTALGAGYGTVGGYGASPYGYGVRTGQVGSGYQSAARLYNYSYQAARPQTVTSYQPLINAITLLPGWNGPSPSYRVHRRRRTQSDAPHPPPFDDTGKIIWPSTIPNDPSSVSLRKAADDAVKSVVLEWKATGHGSVRPVIDAKKKLSAYEHAALPAVKSKNATDGTALESFFVDLDRVLDVLTLTY